MPFQVNFSIHKSFVLFLWCNGVLTQLAIQEEKFAKNYEYICPANKIFVKIQKKTTKSPNC